MNTNNVKSNRKFRRNGHAIHRLDARPLVLRAGRVRTTDCMVAGEIIARDKMRYIKMMAQNNKGTEIERQRMLLHYERQLDIINGELHSLNQQAAELVLKCEELRRK